MRLAVDAIISMDDYLVLVRRKNEPFRGRLALPGGFVEEGESCEQAVVREVREETGLEGEVAWLVGVYSRPGRDPRGPVVSVCYLLRRTGGRLAASDDAAAIELVPLGNASGLAFDHDQMIGDGKRAVSRLPFLGTML
jgi:8-oxo-dGTP diphosphatase